MSAGFSSWFLPVWTSIPVPTQVPLKLHFAKTLRVLLIWFCIRILWVSISSRPFTLTLSNGIACHERRTRSRSGKCSARVCTDLQIDASIAPMSGRMEPLAAVTVRALSRILQSPWNWAKTNIWRTEYLYLSVQAHIHPIDAWCRFEISSAAAKFCSNRCNACKENSWCIFNGFVFHFCVPAKFFSGMKGSLMFWVIFAWKMPLLRTDVCAFDASQVCFLLWRRLGLSQRFFGLGWCGIPLKAEIFSWQTRPAWGTHREANDWGWKYIGVLLETFGGWWRLLKFSKHCSQKYRFFFVFFFVLMDHLSTGQKRGKCSKCNFSKVSLNWWK